MEANRLPSSTYIEENLFVPMFEFDLLGKRKNDVSDEHFQFAVYNFSNVCFTFYTF